MVSRRTARVLDFTWECPVKTGDQTAGSMLIEQALLKDLSLSRDSGW
jgi:hypothetical protein